MQTTKIGGTSTDPFRTLSAFVNSKRLQQRGPSVLRCHGQSIRRVLQRQRLHQSLPLHTFAWLRNAHTICCVPGFRSCFFTLCQLKYIQPARDNGGGRRRTGLVSRGARWGGQAGLQSVWPMRHGCFSALNPAQSAHFRRCKENRECRELGRLVTQLWTSDVIKICSPRGPYSACLRLSCLH